MIHEPAIEVTNLSKRYRLGDGAVLDGSFREMVTQVPGRLWRRVRGGEKASADQSQELWALRGVGFTVARGEVVGIIGANGAGKSTLLKILSQITDPTEGQAVIHGRVASLLEVGTGFHPELTGRENVYLNGTILGMTRREIDAQFDQIVGFSGVEKFLDTPVKNYSSGMTMRLAFAVAAHLEPEILIVDEVLAVGDAEFQRKCLGKMQDVARNGGRTVLFVSHNMAAVQTLTDRCVLLSAGRVVADGAPESVIAQYLGAQRDGVRTDTSLAPRSSPRLGCEARIMNVIASPSNDASFRFGEDLCFDAVIRSSAALRGLRLGATICELGGAPLLSAVTPQDVDLPVGETTVRLRLCRTGVAPGRYSLALSVGRGGLTQPRTELDVVREGPVFSIEAVTPDGKALFNWRRDYGLMVHDHATAERIHPIPQHKAA